MLLRSDTCTHLEVSFAHVLMLLDIEPKVQCVLGRFALQKDLTVSASHVLRLQIKLT